MQAGCNATGEQNPGNSRCIAFNHKIPSTTGPRWHMFCACTSTGIQRAQTHSFACTCFRQVHRCMMYKYSRQQARSNAWTQALSLTSLDQVAHACLRCACCLLKPSVEHSPTPSSCTAAAICSAPFPTQVYTGHRDTGHCRGAIFYGASLSLNPNRGRYKRVDCIAT